MIIKAVALVVALSACPLCEVEQLHAAAMRQHVYITDQEQYGREDVWRPSLKGDCEDYALWMREMVGGQLLYVRTKDGLAHIVLDVDGLIVDSLSSTIYLRENMKHRFIFALSENHVRQFLEKRGL